MNRVCNFLAYLRNQCYGLRKFNYVFVLKMSAFGRLRQGFAAATAATALFAAPACANDASASAAENGLEPRTEAFCGELMQADNGHIFNARTSSHAYSQENLGNVGISIFAGQDFGDNSPEFMGALLVNEFRARGVHAECFVHHTPVPNGTGVWFHIAGLAQSEESLGITAAFDEDMLDSLEAEAKTAGMLLVADAGDGPATNR